MPPSPDVQRAEAVELYYRLQAQAGATTARTLAALLLAMDTTDVDRAWAAIRERVVATVAAQQYLAASTAVAYFGRLLALADLQPAPEAVLDPAAFVGWTSAGDQVVDIVDATPALTKLGIRAGLPPPRALATTTARVVRLGASEVQDAGRGMLEAQLRLEPQSHGYLRYVKTPACGRCLVLSGRYYRRSARFQRHPQCDCQQIPVFVANPDLPSARDLFHTMTDGEQDKAFTVDGARAIRDGADPALVVNARRGMSAAGDSYTTAGTLGSKRKRRLSPQGIAKQAGDDTVLYRRLLREHGYV